MSSLPRVRVTYVLSLALCVLLLAAMAVPAMAAGKQDKNGRDSGGRSEQAEAAQARNGERKASKASKSSSSQSGRSGGSSSATVTEDNDTNDGGTPNNVVDDGDNKHPSGKDKSVENGNSGNQGNSTSDPDDDGRGPDRSNGGADKPDGPGGEDLADQDGNNGCGNDDDFEDDNEGWCGKPALTESDEAADEDQDDAPAEGEQSETCTEEMATGQMMCEPQDKPCVDEMGDSTTCASETDADAAAPCTAEMTGDEVCADDSDAAAPCTAEMVDGEAAECDLIAAPSADLESDDEGVLGIQGQALPEEDSLVRFLGDAGVPSGMVAAVGGASDALAATGLPTIVLALLALSGLGVGTGLVRRGRRG